jgi:predicted patatin/cPLA2 family phospholipase
MRNLVLVGGLASTLLVGCAGYSSSSRVPTPTAAGLNTNNLIDVSAQIRADKAVNPADLIGLAEKVQTDKKPSATTPRRSVLCLSGGGAYGAYSVGVLCGWTCRGDRPTFDVVTGISTGALIAPFAFLGPKYDPQVRKFYTELENRDIYRLLPVRGLFTESLADNAPLASKIDEMLTCDVMRELAAEHGKGRRLYIGTTEAEGRRFVIWDVGEIACRGTPRDRELIKQVLLGSSAIPGFFPPAKIQVTVNGQKYVEKHVDGGVSQSLFFRPPYVAPEYANNPEAKSSDNTDVYVIVAGKLFGDPDVIKPRSLRIAASDVSTIIYAQTRGDLQRLWTVCTLTGMRFHMAAIRPEFPAPKSSTDFKPDALTAMFNEGVQQVMTGTAWRSTPPSVESGENPLIRSDTNLIYEPRSPDAVSGGLPPAPNRQPR